MKTTTKQAQLSRTPSLRRVMYAASGVAVLMLSYQGWRTAHEWYTVSRLKAAAMRLHVDFDVSMNIDAYQHLPALKNPVVEQLLAITKRLYNKYNLAAVTPIAEAKIPKIIHHVWLGSKLPGEYEGYYQSWRAFHPDWVFVFWTDNTANYDKGTQVLGSFDELNQKLAALLPTQRTLVVDVNRLTFDNRALYNETPFYGERSDILKWEIVHRHGGVYVDTDFECLKSLDLLHHMYDLYTGIQPLDTSFPGQLGAGIFAAIPHHPVMEQCVTRLAAGRSRAQIIDRSGPLHFTRVFAELAGRKNIDIAFPVSYFYPCTYEQRGTASDNWLRPESFAVHHWAGSWLKPEAVLSQRAMHEYVMKQINTSSGHIFNAQS